jgi:hypothetical protein
MEIPRRQFLHLAGGAAALPAVSRFAWAQAYPMKRITMIVPFAAGGATDVIARIVAARMRVSLGQPVIIENVTGANGSIGVGRAVHAARSTASSMWRLRRERTRRVASAGAPMRRNSTINVTPPCCTCLGCDPARRLPRRTVETWRKAVAFLTRASQRATGQHAEILWGDKETKGQ